MTRQLGECPVCGRRVFLVNDRYPDVPTRLRSHYPKPYSHYDNQSVPARYCPGSAPRKDNP